MLDDEWASRTGFTRHELLSGSTPPPSTPQAVLEVTTLADVVDASDGVLSLREAIESANATPGRDTITFADGLFGGTITLTGNLPTIVDDLVIDGDPLDRGAGAIVIDGKYGALGPGEYGAPIAFSVQDAAFDVMDLTIRNIGLLGIEAQNADINGERFLIENAGFYVPSGMGVGIHMTAGQLTLSEAVIERVGAGIELFGATATIQDSTIGPNGAEYSIGIWGSGTVQIQRSSIVDNVGITGAGITFVGSLLVQDSAVLGNGSLLGIARSTGISIDGDLTLINSTVADTRTVLDAFYGATDAAVGLTAGSTGRIIHSTITGTTDYDGSPGTGLFVGEGAVVTIVNSIIDDTVVGTITSNGDNTFRDMTVEGAPYVGRFGVRAEELFAETKEIGTSGIRAGVAADNGGPTQTVALKSSAANPALDNADPADAPLLDQRGFARDAMPDIGAFELDAGPSVPPVPALPNLVEKVPLADADILGAPRGFLTLVGGDAEISFVDEYAAFQNSLGVYLIGPDGQIASTAWASNRIEHAEPSDLASKEARPGGGPLSPGDAVLLSDLFDPGELAPGVEFGLFLVADGWNRNAEAVFDGGMLAFRSGDGSAKVTDATPALFHIGEDGSERLVLGDIMHTVDAGSPNPLSNTLNPGGRGQVTSGILDGQFTVAFEDKPLAKSDRDFNDALFAIDLLDDAPALFVAPASGAETASASAVANLEALLITTETVA